MNFQVVQQFEDPVGSTVISPIGVKGLVPLEGISSSDSRVKADKLSITNICLIKSVSFQNSVFPKRVDPKRVPSFLPCTQHYPII